MNKTSQALPGLSFEFFPPHSPKASLRLWQSVERLAPFEPDFVSVTYGAGGTTRDRTMAAIQAILERAHLNVAGHLTCVGATREETLDVARAYLRNGVRSIVALRGDPPKGETVFRPHPDGFASAAELIAGLRGVGDFTISVAGYPEKHPESPDLASDIENLKRKVDAGAANVVTQFFFENADFLRFRDACAAAGISVPIIPGILPVENFSKMINFAARCQSGVPAWMHDVFGKADTPESAQNLAVSVASDQCRGLVSEGVQHLHFYTLNNPDLTRDICRTLGFQEAPAANGSSMPGVA